MDKFKVGDRVKVIDYPDDIIEIGSEGIIKGYDEPYWLVLLDNISDEDDYGFLLDSYEIELIPVEQPYDPTQMGDTDDDI